MEKEKQKHIVSTLITIKFGVLQHFPKQFWDTTVADLLRFASVDVIYTETLGSKHQSGD